MLEEVVRKDLLALFETYAEAMKITTKAASFRIYGNALWLAEFRKGERSVSLRLVDDMHRQFIENWPKGVKWPAKLLTQNPNRDKKPSPWKRKTKT